MFTPIPLLRLLSPTGFALCAALALPAPFAAAQDTPDPRLPGAAKLALRGKAGDTVKMEGKRKVDTRIHFEALQVEFSAESTVKDNSTYEYRGPGPNGTLQIEAHGTTRVTVTNAVGQSAKPITSSRSILCTVRSNLEMVKATPLGTTRGSKQVGHTLATAPTVVVSQSFGLVRFPDKPVKAGDTWSGTVTITEADDLRGATLHYTATVVGFEMYQSFPCAHVEVNFNYHGPLPAIEAQSRKTLPKGSKVSCTGDLTGSETAYYVLDRGWPLNDQTKLTVALNLVVTANDKQFEVGGTIDVDDHSAVTGYPPYAPALVPAVASSPSPN